MPFEGFAGSTLSFLAELGRNNTKVWFDAHRADYEACYLAPAVSFVEAAAPFLQRLAPGMQAEPRINGSIFRINRDPRFSPDKRPYKDHLDLWFWEGERKGAVSGLFFRLTAERLILGAGAHMFDKARLDAFRKAIVDPESGGALRRAIEAVEREGRTVNGEHYRKPPPGYVAESKEAERLLRFNALWSGEEMPHPSELGSPRLVDFCVARWRTVLPLHRWLVDTIQ